MDKIRVLLVVDHAKGTSGPHRNVVGTLNALALHQDVSLSLLCNEYDENELFARSKATKLYTGFNPKKPLAILTNAIKVVWALFKCDVVYVPTNLTTFLYVAILGFFKKKIAGPNVTGIPVIMDANNQTAFMTTTLVNRWIENSAIRKYHCMRAGTAEEQIAVILHSINSDDFNPTKRDVSLWQKYGLETDRLKIVHVGRANEERKGIAQMFEAFHKLNVDNKYDLVYAGPKGACWKDDYDTIPGFHYLGKVYGDDLQKLYASSDIFFALSSWETFWFTPLEAMASGLPCVITEVGAVDEMIPTNGIEGYKVEGVDIANSTFELQVVDESYSALKKLCESEELRIEMGIKARERAVSRFSEKTLGNDLVTVIKDVLQ
ncbi:MAG: glycosyltransferase family 4 protein [Fibrobacterales bacterium]